MILKRVTGIPWLETNIIALNNALFTDEDHAR